jgi:hypothetical protein
MMSPVETPTTQPLPEDESGPYEATAQGAPGSAQAEGAPGSAQTQGAPGSAPAEGAPGSAPPQAQRPWPGWYAPAGLAAALVLAAVGGLILDIPAALLGVNVSSGHLPAGLEIANTVVQDLAFIAAPVIFAGLGGRAVHAWQLGLRPTALRRAAGAVVLTLIAFLIFTAIWSALVEVSTKEELLKQLGVERGTALLIASAVLTCVIAPIGEEVLFRGFFFPSLSNWCGWLGAAVLTGLVFGGIHAGSAPAVDLVPLAALGFALCVLYRRTGSLYPCIATHVLNNSLAFGAIEHWGWQIPVLMVAALAAVALLALALRRAGVIDDPPAVSDGSFSAALA